MAKQKKMRLCASVQKPFEEGLESLFAAIGQLFASFATMTLDVIPEGSTPTGKTNGLWAVAPIIPATG